MLNFFSSSKSPTKLKTLTGFVLGIITVFAAYLLAQAIAPGTVTVPPQDITQDVELRRPLDCQVISGNSIADCDDIPPEFTYTLTGGGGACNEDDSDEPDFYPDRANNQFRANCGDSNDEVAYAICCKFVQ